jgi:thioredoxin 1
MESFREIINSQKPVLVDFYADWCGPCKAMAPVLKEVAEEIKDQARIIKVNIDRNSRAADELGIRAVPTFVIFKNGKEQWRHAGMIDKQTLLQQTRRLSR